MAGSLSIKPLERDVGRTFDVLVLILLGGKHFDQKRRFFPDQPLNLVSPNRRWHNSLRNAIVHLGPRSSISLPQYGV